MRNRLKTLAFVSLYYSALAHAGDTHYCTGKVLSIVTRASTEDTQVRIEGLNGMARLGFGGESFRYLHERQFATLLAASLAGKEVTLEFLNQDGNCSEDHNGELIRFVSINP
ncbi:hypothetical protein P886_1992 [Alteromonadaceae bacterium 2753L.S.0a.02]|nr:hypothetical protein P886_1992 [Alteromonadaceae bacterium 2753L.S.0a.02]